MIYGIYDIYIYILWYIINGGMLTHCYIIVLVECWLYTFIPCRNKSIEELKNIIDITYHYCTPTHTHLYIYTLKTYVYILYNIYGNLISHNNEFCTVKVTILFGVNQKKGSVAWVTVLEFRQQSNKP